MGVVLLGERPGVLAWAGIVITIPALWLVSTTCGPTSGSALPMDAVIAGVGMAGQYLAVAFPAATAGLWPLTAGRGAAILTILPLLLSRNRRQDPAASGPHMSGSIGRALALGMLPAAALALYTLAAREGLLTTAVVLSSLYPVIPVVLGIAVLGERPGAARMVGFAGAAAAVLLITTGS